MKKNVSPTPEKTVAIAPVDEKKKKSFFAPKKEEEKKYVKINLYDDTLFQLGGKKVNVVANQILGSRKTQQDAFAVSESVMGLSTEKTRAWALVCDGMGGMASGELASAATSDIMKQILGTSMLGDSIPEILKQGAYFANEEVKKLSASLDGTAGTTLVCTVLDDNNLYYISIGDSRIYIYRRGEFVQVNRDHNYFLELTEMVKKGEITQEEAEADPQKEALISFVGIDNLELIDINLEPLKLENQDIVLLCSDGLTKVLKDEEIKEFIKSANGNIDEILGSLLVEVQAGNIRNLDNTTIAIMQYLETE